MKNFKLYIGGIPVGEHNSLLSMLNTYPYIFTTVSVLYFFCISEFSLVIFFLLLSTFFWSYLIQCANGQFSSFFAYLTVSLIAVVLCSVMMSDVWRRSRKLSFVNKQIYVYYLQIYWSLKYCFICNTVGRHHELSKVSKILWSNYFPTSLNGSIIPRKPWLIKGHW